MLPPTCNHVIFRLVQDYNGVMDNIMQQLLSRELMYDPIKQVGLSTTRELDPRFRAQTRWNSWKNMTVSAIFVGVDIYTQDLYATRGAE